MRPSPHLKNNYINDTPLQMTSKNFTGLLYHRVKQTSHSKSPSEASFYESPRYSFTPFLASK